MHTPTNRRSRRRFLRQSSALAAGLAAAPFPLARAAADGARRLAEGPPLGVGIIGTGSRGGGLTSLLAEVDGAEARAVCDLIPFRLEAAAEIAGPKAKAYADYRALLDDPAVDAVLLATPFGMHGPMALEILDAGKHLYCEKTMVRGEDDVRAVLAAAERKPELTFQTGHQYHSSALYRRAKQFVDEGYLGELTAIHCQWHRNGDWRRPVPDPKWERMINWRMYTEYSGGLVAELMSHQLDFCNWITGEHPARIAGQGGIDYWKDGRETLDNAHLQVEYTGGLDATFSCTTINGFGDYRIWVYGKRATVELGYDWGKVYLEPTERPELGTVDGVSGATVRAWRDGEGVPIEADGGDATLQALQEFVRCVRAGEQPESDVTTGALAARCVDMGIRAARGGTTVEWAT